jgi:methylase of polypeptide subunit release factors
LHRTNILMEIGLNQAPGVTEFVKAIMPASQIETVPDKAGIDRMIKIEI